MTTMEELIVQKLQKLKVTYEVTPGNDWIKCQCINPEHHDSHPSAGVNIHSGIFNCFSCGHTERFITADDDVSAEDILWQTKYNNLAVTTTDDIVQEHTEIVLPPVAYKLHETWRGIDKELLEELGVYYCNQGRYRGRYVFPIYYRGKAISFDARVVDDTAKVIDAKWIRPKGIDLSNITYPYDKLKDMGGTHIVITEGVMDAISYIQMGVMAIPSFGLGDPGQARIEDLIRLGIEDVTIAFDNDEAGIEGTLRVLPRYTEWFNIKSHPMVSLIKLQGYKDANDFLVAKRS